MNKKIILSHYRNASEKDWKNWRWQFQNRVTSIKELAGMTDRLMPRTEKLRHVLSSYPMAITPYFLSLIETNDENNPLALQCFPDEKEVSVSSHCSDDPLNEDCSMPVPKLIQRYPDRVLAIVTRTCATYCRHCNRKRFWGKKEPSTLKSRLGKMVQYVADSPGIREVILSGGDPLIYDDDQMDMILSSFAAIPHLEVLRVGSRAPAVMPMRITKELCRILKRYRPLWFNTQFNHPSEITADAERACNMLQEAGIPVSNQSVLLKGVNDKEDVMRRLLYGLQKISVRPYYLFHCDPVKGCDHFRTDVKAGLAMMENIWRQCSGLSLPQYVLDVPGSTGKIPLTVISRAIQKDLQKHQHFFDKFRQID
jgi:lysine 2,3-aminomutase